jgi:hypothetical protein
MPCYEVRLTTVEFKAEHKDLLMDAIKSLKLNAEILADGRISLHYGAIVLDLKAGQAQVQDGYQAGLNNLKRAYTAQAVSKFAKLQGWVNQDKRQQLTTTGQLIKF